MNSAEATNKQDNRKTTTAQAQSSNEGTARRSKNGQGYDNAYERVRGINVEDDAGVRQYQKGTEEHVKVLTEKNFRKITT